MILDAFITFCFSVVNDYDADDDEEEEEEDDDDHNCKFLILQSVSHHFLGLSMYVANNVMSCIMTKTHNYCANSDNVRKSFLAIPK